MATRESTRRGPRVKDLTGQRFGRLVVIKMDSKKDGRYRWLCKCDCGNTSVIQVTSLRTGKTQSCGCFGKEIRMWAMSTRNGSTKKNRDEYTCWCRMIRRCTDRENEFYENYGGRGITVCDRWTREADGWNNFLKDMGPRPSKELSLDRIDNNKGYYPNNCRWATRTQQQRNKRNTVKITYNGKTMCVVEWAEEIGVSYKCLMQRLRKGWSITRALTTPAEERIYG